MAARATRELAQRATDGVEVRLLWHSETNTISVSVVDAKSGDQFELQVPDDAALDVFHHPYAYATGCRSRSRESRVLGG